MWNLFLRGGAAIITKNFGDDALRFAANAFKGTAKGAASGADDLGKAAAGATDDLGKATKEAGFLTKYWNERSFTNKAVDVGTIYSVKQSHEDIAKSTTEQEAGLETTERNIIAGMNGVLATRHPAFRIVGMIAAPIISQGYKWNAQVNNWMNGTEGADPQQPAPQEYASAPDQAPKQQAPAASSRVVSVDPKIIELIRTAQAGNGVADVASQSTQRGQTNGLVNS